MPVFWLFLASLNKKLIMKNKHYFSSFIVLSVLLLSACKNDPKEEVINDSNKSRTVVQKERPAPSAEKIKLNNSIMVKVMATPELKTFTSCLVTAGMIDTFLKEEGPFTILAPSNSAFEKLEKEKYNALFNQTNKDVFEKVIKTHIVEGMIDSVTLVQDIKKNGSTKLTTLSGVVLTATMDGNEIVIKDPQGTIAIIGKSDIKGQNGVLHIIDTVLNID